MASIVVEFAKESRPRRDVYEGNRGFGYNLTGDHFYAYAQVHFLALALGGLRVLG